MCWHEGTETPGIKDTRGICQWQDLLHGPYWVLMPKNKRQDRRLKPTSLLVKRQHTHTHASTHAHMCRKRLSLKRSRNRLWSQIFKRSSTTRGRVWSLRKPLPKTQGLYACLRQAVPTRTEQTIFQPSPSNIMLTSSSNKLQQSAIYLIPTVYL